MINFGKNKQSRVQTSRKRQKRRQAIRETKIRKKRSTPYKVRVGDSLWALARRWKVSIQTIKRLNHLKTNRIDAGQKLYIPR